MPEARDLHALQLLAIIGSLRRASTNPAVLEALAGLAPDDVEVTIYRGLAELPAFNADDDEDDPPEQVRALRGLVASSQGIFIAAPEYAHGVPGALKNALDWLVASDAFPGKPVALVNTAPRAFHAQVALRETLATMSARLIPEAFVALPLTGKMVDADAILANKAFAAALRESLDSFRAASAAD